MARPKKDKVEKHLPERAPKRTGKAGIKPLDPVEDFDTPVRKTMREAQEILDAEPMEEAVVEEEPEEEIAGSEDPQGVLLEIPESEAPPSVMKDRMLVHYVKPHFKKTKKGERTVSLEFSVPLTKEHEDLIPAAVATGWKFLSKRGMKRLDITEVPAQAIRLWLAHDDQKETLFLPLAGMTNVSLATIQQKGEGQARKVIRLSFRAIVKMSAAVGKWAEYNFEENVWMNMADSQEVMFPEDEEDE